MMMIIIILIMIIIIILIIIILIIIIIIIIIITILCRKSPLRGPGPAKRLLYSCPLDSRQKYKVWSACRVSQPSLVFLTGITVKKQYLPRFHTMS